MKYIYIIELKDKKYYIGKTCNPDFRLSNHFNSNGSEWTKIHEPIRVLELIPNCDNYDEDKWTLKYMEKYGIQRVRGGSFCQLTLNSHTLSIIQRMIQTSTDKCYNCGQSGHFAKNCINDLELARYMDKLCQTCYREGHKTYQCPKSIKRKVIAKRRKTSLSIIPKCHRCKRHGHYTNECYAIKTVNGYKITPF